MATAELSGCVLVSGMPAAGKTTVTGLAAPLLPRAARIKADDVMGLLAPRPVRLITLAPTVEVCQQRNTTRHPEERFEFDGYDRLAAELRRDFQDVGWWFDTSALTPEETAEQLVREAAHRALLTAGRMTTHNRPH